MENNNKITGFEFLYTMSEGYNQYYEGFTISTLFESDIEIGDTRKEDTVILAKDVDQSTVNAIIQKLNDEHFYHSLLKELQQDQLIGKDENEKYRVSIGFGCRAEDHNLMGCTTSSIELLHTYLKELFDVK